MVLEHLFPEDWLEKKTKYAFLLGVGYSIIGLVLAAVLFPSDPALVAVAFTSLLLLPSLYKIFSIEERIEEQETRFKFGELMKDNWAFIKTYLFLFLGILLVYSVGSIFLTQMVNSNMFREQLAVMAGSALKGNTGHAWFNQGLFTDLFQNNLRVLMYCFLFSLFTGDGAIFLITWNASVWGTIFGFYSKHISIYFGETIAFLVGHPALSFLLIMAVVFWHMILEAGSYIFAAISGGVISKALLHEKIGSDQFSEVIIYNLFLLGVAFLLLVAGAFVETLVLNNISVISNLMVSMLRVTSG
ncbi:stage II sporulation protein M [Candidatus Woesearchaeota archaeon]|nr:stage II sporulation protein M [Candidatus Woesearchaeota archaeon]